jgi:hypothetical protein
MEQGLKYGKDIACIMSKVNQNGGNLWATNDSKVWKGTPFSTRDVALILIDLGFTKEDKIIQDIAELLFSLQTKDGRFRISPSGAVYPCHTIGIARPYATWDTLKIRGSKKLLIISSIPIKKMAAGNVINSCSEEVPAPNIQIRDQH